MNRNKWALCVGIMALFAVLFAPSAKADLYFESENVSTNLPNQPNGTAIQKNYFTSNRSRIEMGNGKVFILDYNAMKLFTLDSRAKTYTELNLGEVPGLPEDMPAANKEKMAELMGAVLAIHVTPTNEVKTIEGYQCRKYNANLATMNGEYWVSKDVKGYKELKAMGAKLGTFTERYPMLRQINIAGMVDKLDGFPVYAINHMMGGTVESTLKKIEQKTLDPGLFVIPKDYALKKKK
jgi:hypothetical protein